MNFAVTWIRTSVAVALLALTFAAPASAGELDQSQPQFDSTQAAWVGPYSQMAQTFVAGATGSLDRVDVSAWIYDERTTEPLNVQIRTATADGPTDAVLASTAIPAAAAGQWATNNPLALTEIQFDDPAQVLAGRRYAIVLIDPLSSASSWTGWLVSSYGTESSDPYPEGGFFSTQFAELIWSPWRPWLDLGFKTYVTRSSVDQTDPNLTVIHTANGSNGWNTSASVDLAISAADGESGLLGSPTCTDNGHGVDVIGDSGVYSTTVRDDGVHDVVCRVSDRAGNTRTSSDEVKIDTVAPTFVTVPGDGGYVYLDWPYPPTCDARDGGSGIDTRGSVTSGITTPPTDVGDFSFTCDGAVDAAGNRADAATFSFHVFYPWPDDFSAPVENRDQFAHYIQNEAKSGSTIPMKFSLGGKNRGMNILATNSPKSVTVPCDSTLPTDTIEEYATTSVQGLNYEPGGARYTYNWKTSSDWAGTCRQFLLKLRDGSTHEARFKFVK